MTDTTITSPEAPVVACAREDCAFAVPAIRIREGSPYCSAACADVARQARALRRKPHPRGARDLAADIEMLDKRVGMTVAEGRSTTSPSTVAPTVACLREGCVFPVPPIRVWDGSRHCSAACADVTRRARQLRKNPRPRGARDLAAFIETLNKRDPIMVAQGLDFESQLVRRIRHPRTNPPR
jgi:hypothetical protein